MQLQIQSKVQLQVHLHTLNGKQRKGIKQSPFYPFTEASGLSHFSPGDDARQKWLEWTRALEIYFEVHEITDSKKKKQKLLHLGGLELQRIYFALPQGDVSFVDAKGEPVLDDKGEATKFTEYEAAKWTLTNHFVPKLNVIYERHMMRSMTQASNEKFDDFLLRLREQARKCDYCKEDEKREVILQIVEGGRSPKLRARLLESDRSLEEVISIARTMEEVEKQTKAFSATPLDFNAEISRVTSRFNQPRGPSQDSKRCYRYDRQGHFANDKSCTAWGVKCDNCGVMNHLSVACKRQRGVKRPHDQRNYHPKRAKARINRVEKQETSEEEPETGTYSGIFHVRDVKRKRKVEVHIGGCPVQMLVDSEATANMITVSTYHELMRLNASIQVKETGNQPNFKCYGVPEENSTVEIVVTFQATIQARMMSADEEFYVARFGQENLMSEETALNLHLLMTGYEVQGLATARVSEEFPKVPNLKVRISIDPSVKPIALPYRHIPMALEELVNKKLENLEACGVIERIKKPPQWVSNIVPIQKTDGDVRVCVDMRRANEAVLRENFPLGNIELMLATIPRSALFSKVDLESAYFHLELEEDCHYVTAFITRRGIFQFTRLMFGVRSAPEIFAKSLSILLAGLEGIIVYLDDVLVFGRTSKEHDENLRKLLERLKELNFRVNEKKSQYRVHSVEFLGHTLTVEGLKPTNEKLKKILNFRRPESVNELRSYLGLVTYVGRFVPHLSTLTDGMRQLVKEGTIRNWNHAHDKSLQEIKKV